MRTVIATLARFLRIQPTCGVVPHNLWSDAR
jgi:hypothetical protein